MATRNPARKPPISDVIVQLVNNGNKLPTTSSGERRIFSINSSKGTPCCVKLPRFSELDRGRSDRCLEQHFLGGAFRNMLYLPPILGKVPKLTNIFQRGWKPPTSFFFFRPVLIVTSK